MKNLYHFNGFKLKLTPMIHRVYGHRSYLLEVESKQDRLHWLNKYCYNKQELLKYLKLELIPKLSGTYGINADLTPKVRKEKKTIIIETHYKRIILE
jgi:hypothetical protein